MAPRQSPLGGQHRRRALGFSKILVGRAMDLGVGGAREQPEGILDAPSDARLGDCRARVESEQGEDCAERAKHDARHHAPTHPRAQVPA